MSKRKEHKGLIRLFNVNKDDTLDSQSLFRGTRLLINSSVRKKSFRNER